MSEEGSAKEHGAGKGGKRLLVLGLAVAVSLALIGAAFYVFVARVGPGGPAPSQVPDAPAALQVVAGDGTATVSWGAVPGATSYNLYRASEPGVAKDNFASKADGMRFAGVASPYDVGGLVNGRIYYFRVTAVNADGESVESLEHSGTPQVVNVPTPLYVTGLVELDNGGPAVGIDVLVRSEDSTASVTATTGPDGRYNVPLAATFPTRVLVKATRDVAGEPPASGFRWSTEQSMGGGLDVGRIVLPNPEGKQLTKVGNEAISDDSSVYVSGIPATMGAVWARSYVADDQPDVFPGDLAEGTSNPINNVVFLWITALDAAGNHVTAVNPAATVRVRVPMSQWVDLEDLQPGNGVIDTPIYSFDYTSGYWVREANGLLTDSGGNPILESREMEIRTGVYTGAVHAQFLANHFSWWNVDKPPKNCGKDFGDAPDLPYPSLLSSDGARHLNSCRAWLGAGVDSEPDANVPDKDLYDDSVLDNDPLTIRVSNWNTSGYLFLNVLIDSNDDGDWADAGEWVLQNLVVSVPTRKSHAVETDARWDAKTWMRVTLTDAEITAYDGHGEFAVGETEDHPTLRFPLRATVYGNGTVTSDPSGIDCRKGGAGVCVADFGAGTSVNLTATPDPGESFLGWGGDCTPLGTASVCTVLMDAPRTISAAFTQAFYDLYVSVNGNGTVTSSPAGIDCHPGGYPPNPGSGAVCTATFARDTNVTLTATPDAGESFVTWGGACSGAGNSTTCVVLMDMNREVSAQFTRAPYIYVYDAGNSTGQGNVTSSPAGIDCHIPRGGSNTSENKCYFQFTRNSTVVLTATPDPGSVFVDWGGACTGTTPTCTLVMDGDKTVTARFA